MVAVTITVPAPLVFKVLLLILALVVPALLTVHIMVLLVALEGDTVPFKVTGVPAVADVDTPVMFDTATKAAPPPLTVMVKFWV